jgi:hypothetical protein
MKTKVAKVTKIYNSEYGGYFEVELEVNNERFLSTAVFSKASIRDKFNLTDEEFEQLIK